MTDYVRWLSDLGMDDVPVVGGKNASLGEMIQNLTHLGVSVPGGFATTADAYREFLAKDGLDERIQSVLDALDVEDVSALAEAGPRIRGWVMEQPFPAELDAAIDAAYAKLTAEAGTDEVSWAVRSSATAEDLPDASFAGQQETFLNVHGLDNIKHRIKEVFASLFNDRAISYRVHQGFEHRHVALSAGIQRMVRSDLASSGVMFTLDTESGFRDAVFITASYGLGEMVVQGAVNPDEFYVHKPTLVAGRPAILRRTVGDKAIRMVYSDPEHDAHVKTEPVPEELRPRFSLTDDEVQELAKQAILIEQHYGRPMDIEWAKDGTDGNLYVVQARPETVQSRTGNVIERYILKGKGPVLTTGRSIGSRIGAGAARIVESIADMNKVQPGDVLITDMTDPDWEPVMKRAAAIVTNRGGRTCFSGDTRLLTNKGFMSFAEVHEQGHEGLSVPALDRTSLKVEWKPVEAVMKKQAKTIRVEVSQTGRMQGNTLTLTPDHKMLNLADGALVDTEMQQMLADEDAVLLAQHLPALASSTGKERSLAYLLGGLMSDGHIYLNRTHGEVTFIQKPTELKQQFIERMNEALVENYGKRFSVSTKQVSQGFIRGVQVVGQANAYRCYSKAIAEDLSREQDTIVTTLLKSDRELAAHFLAGLIDGDGCFKNGRVNLYVSDEETLQAVIVACLRLGTVPQVTRNRHIHNVQIVEQLDLIGRYTQRVACRDERQVGSRFFNARQLFAPNVNSDINNRVRKGYLVTERAIREALPKLETEHAQRLHTLLESDLRQARVRQVEDGDEQAVYNITVADHHNYIVFTERYTPVMVNNCHAAIIARELGVPAVVGCNNATEMVQEGQPVTVSCAEGDTGFIYDGQLDFEYKTVELSAMPEIPVKIMMNVGNPDRAFAFSATPNAGIGLARLEFIINNMIGIHPKALLEFDQLPADLKAQIAPRIAAYASPREFYVAKLAEGISTLAAAFAPNTVIVRMSDFKSNEYANLIGGPRYEPEEENPMIGFRGAGRYVAENFRDCFEMECEALKRVRNDMGLTNVEIMIPFVRTLGQAKAVTEALSVQGLERGKDGLRLIMMCELPSNAVLAEEFLEYFDGFSIGSNDMTQLTLGLDRDSSLVAEHFDERDPAVKKMLSMSIAACRAQGKYVGICGQGPSDHKDFADWLLKQGISSISLNPDTVIDTWLYLAEQAKTL
ncbi:phosphoenolpyruvate synthase [Allochromatium palmeri]|uniref:Phosphoenolpyruvate synthase n=1 Tax=Allochromatium palmeri TaxID=231048 RepID=A0A6N8EBJ7_9GAMM|nr:phosphoenolpyruvate synthase [Allochromatium palmeri]MTW21603.1 phosphoenolpyruvate synthase [Allochromatium palmeri]